MRLLFVPLCKSGLNAPQRVWQSNAMPYSPVMGSFNVAMLQSHPFSIRFPTSELGVARLSELENPDANRSGEVDVMLKREGSAEVLDKASHREYLRTP